jgi:single-stranded DNA-binding protein
MSREGPRRSPEQAGKGKSPMFRFTLQGRIGRIEQVPRKDGGDATVVRISLAADRLVVGRDGAWTKTEWLAVVSFDEKLNRELLAALEVGQSAKLDGRIEPRKRQVGDASIADHSFVLTKFERLSKPPAKAAAKAA